MVAKRRASSARRHSEQPLAAEHKGVGNFIRAKRCDDWKLREELGSEEPQVIAEFSSQSVKRAKELDLWVTRVREARDQAQRADEKLAEALCEARELQEELQIGRADLVQLRAEAEKASKQKQRWESQLEVSRSCIRKLEARLLQIRRTTIVANSAPARSSTALEVEQRSLQELDELVRQRSRLMREREALERQAEEHEREVRSLTLALRATPALPPSGATRADAFALEEGLKQDLRSVEQESEVLKSRLAAEGENVKDIRRDSEVVSSELSDCRSASNDASKQCADLNDEACNLQKAASDLAAEAATVRREEAAAKEEAAALQLECSESTIALRKQQAAKSDAARRLRELEASLVQARKEAAAAQAEDRASSAELEVQCRKLRGELEQEAALREEGLSLRAKREAESADLEAQAGHLALELQAGELAGSQLEAALAQTLCLADAQQAEMQAQELASHELTKEVAEAACQEEALRAELIEERKRAQEASNVAAALFERRQLIADEAEKALRNCNDAIAESGTAGEELLRRNEQLHHSERSSEIMRTTLSQKLATVHAQVREAENAHAKAVGELRRERREHSRLNLQLQQETAKQRARIARGPLGSWRTDVA